MVLTILSLVCGDVGLSRQSVLWVYTDIACLKKLLGVKFGDRGGQLESSFSSTKGLDV
jgi:hypothetical protein